VLIGLFLLFLIGNPRVFSSPDIYYSFMSTIPFFGIMALAMTFVVTLGEIDLSFPSILGFSAWVFGTVLKLSGSLWPPGHGLLPFGGAVDGRLP
jgi:simple sugar transport system permease protein